MLNRPPARSTVLWAQVLGLAVLQGSITWMWVVYNLYLPKLLSGFSLPDEVAASVLAIETGLAIVLEPLMGLLSDRSRHALGSRLPFITIGIILSAVLFVGLPVIASLGNVAVGLRGILPMALIAWAIAMMIFRSPALAQLGSYATSTKLPAAASILTLISAVAGATGTLAQNWLVSLGPGVAFTSGSIVLLLAALVLRRSQPQIVVEPTPVPTTRFSLTHLSLIVGAGLGIAFGISLMREMLNSVSVQPEFGLLTPLLAPLMVFSLVHILTVIPAGRFASRIGNRRALLLGLSALMALLFLLSLTASSWFGWTIVLLLGAAFSLVATSTLPFALSMVPAGKAGLGTGLYFGGAALAGLLLPIAGSLTLVPLLLKIGLAWLGAGFCIAAGTRAIKPS